MYVISQSYVHACVYLSNYLDQAVAIRLEKSCISNMLAKVD